MDHFPDEESLLYGQFKNTVSYLGGLVVSRSSLGRCLESSRSQQREALVHF